MTIRKPQHYYLHAPSRSHSAHIILYLSLALFPAPTKSNILLKFKDSLSDKVTVIHCRVGMPQNHPVFRGLGLVLFVQMATYEAETAEYGFKGYSRLGDLERFATFKNSCCNEKSIQRRFRKYIG